jgi:ACS family glucarate transporter-like MFS transporter
VELAAEAAERPTRVRYGVLAFLCSLTFVLYLDRVCMGKATVSIQQDLHISDTAMGFVHGVFMVSYAVFELPVGRWGDRFGSRGVLTRIVLCWSLFTAMTGAMFDIWRLMIVRFLFGAGEAGGFPNTARVISRWFPGRARGPAQGLVVAAAQVGGALAPVVAAYLIRECGWRMTFLIFGLVGVVWAIAFYAWFRDNPEDHPAANRAECELLRPGAAAAQGSAHTQIPWRIVFGSPNLWLLGAAMNCGAFAFYMYVSWFPKYLETARGVDPITSGWLSSSILAGGAIGCLAGGYVGNWVLERVDNRRLARRIIGCGGFAVASVALLCGVSCESPVASSLFTALALLAGQVQLTAWWATVADISGEHVGAMFGLMNSLGGFAGFGSQVFFGWFGDWMEGHGFVGRAKWDPAFIVYGAVYAIGAILWLFIDANRSIVQRNESEGVGSRE